MVSKRFSDGELYVQIQQSIRGCDVFLIQPTCSSEWQFNGATDNGWCCKRARQTNYCCYSYFGYARAEKTSGRESITAVTANLLEKSELIGSRYGSTFCANTRIFRYSPDHIYGSPVLVDYLESLRLEEVVVVSPDVGGVARARAFAKLMNDAPLAIITGRLPQYRNQLLLGKLGKTAILMTIWLIPEEQYVLCQFIKRKGQREYLHASCCILPPSHERQVQNLFEQVIVTNNCVMVKNSFLSLRLAANMLGEAIWRIHEESSVSSMFR